MEFKTQKSQGTTNSSGKIAPLFMKKNKEAQTVKTTPSSSSIKQKQKPESMVKTQVESQWLFSQICQIWEEISQISGAHSKSSKLQIITRYFKRLGMVSKQTLIKAYYLCINKTGPDYSTKQLGIGKQTLNKTAISLCALSQKQYFASLKEQGDLGSLVMKYKGTQRGIDTFLVNKKKQKITIERVFNTMKSLSQISGKKSASQKQSLIIKLSFAASSLECKYIFRWLEGNLKIQFAQKSMQQALTISLFQIFFPLAAQTDQVLKDYQLTIKKALSEYPDYSTVIQQLFLVRQEFHKLPNLCRITPGIPCKPMLAKPTKGFTQVLQRFQGKQFTCQYKYDGLRGQIHYVDKQVLIYSRNLQNMTQAYPDLIVQVKKIAEALSVNKMILDSQIVAVNPSSKQLLPFQTLSTRSKTNVSICMFLFDLLYFDQPLVDLPLRARQQILRQKFSGFKGPMLDLAQANICTEVQKMDQFLSQSVKMGAQGLMVKDLDSKYCPAKRSFQWIKLKKDYIEGLGDSIDCVPVGAWFGTGKRSGVYGSYLLAIYNQDMSCFQTICKIGTGFSDEVLQAAYNFFQDKLLTKKPQNVKHSEQEVQQWFMPSAVWEVKGADLQLSPIYTCGMTDGRGIGLRFPRLLRVRGDKKPQECTSSQSVRQLYQSQSVVQNSKNVRNDEQDDYY